MQINVRGQLLDLSSPKVMGILNLTPDSFFDGGQYVEIGSALKQAERMLFEGADIIDIGGMSSRPGAKIITAEEECKRVIPVIDALHKRFPELPISVDTIHASVAKSAIEVGAGIVNDISGGNFDKQMVDVVKKQGVPYIIMHMRGTPETMQSKTKYSDVTLEVFLDLKEKFEHYNAIGIKDIIIDPGFGFAKTVPQNFELLNQLSVFKVLTCPILVGLSRKSMITQALDIKKENALNGTTVLNTIALMHGASILRVHDVHAAKEVVNLYMKTIRANTQ